MNEPRQVLRLLPCTIALFLLAIVRPTTVDAQTMIDTPSTIIIKMIDRSTAEWRFEPSEFTVAPGDTVRFVQDDQVPHNVEFTDSPKGSRIDSIKMGPFLFAPGETYDVVVSEKFALGVYKFICTPHKPMGMVGEMTVVSGKEFVELKKRASS